MSNVIFGHYTSRRDGKQRRVRKTQVDRSLHVVSIDPGIRFPFTWYSPSKGVGKIGTNDIGRIVRTCAFMDKLHSKKDKLYASTSKRKKAKAKRIDKAIARMRRNIQHLQTEIHRKSINFLAQEFDVVIIPPFEAEELGILVIIQNEAFTSKTYSCCWNVQNINGKKVYQCQNCKINMDRDINGAQGILLRALLNGAVLLHAENNKHY
ncbi:hypothetical protein RhiirA5_432718 [Rhizophagus irregularis]|uniref:Cas12f1-like TNB domain-containing protein n=1 Tax=Rhizophagus irregularis TaxID=588596 RepID=A0A2I1F1G7_9GLOM|nr:hypothetical protein RhiirA5_432718 [Rhizophagus irregularis]PKY28215.1 hypothetical protein RhiirB3_444277 [Rhizophagus irregularis]